MSGSFFCSVSVHLKGQGQRSQKSLENHVLACISVVSGTIGMHVGIVVYNHKWVIKRSGSEVKGHIRALKTMF